MDHYYQKKNYCYNPSHTKDVKNKQTSKQKIKKSSQSQGRPQTQMTHNWLHYPRGYIAESNYKLIGHVGARLVGDIRA